jgi:hypothetical protein
MRSIVVESVSTKGIKFRVWPLLTFPRGMLRQWGIAVIRNETKSPTRKEAEP